MIVLPDAENRTIVSLFVWTRHRNVADRQTNSLAITTVCIAFCPILCDIILFGIS